MQPEISVTGFISRPVADVYEAVADPGILSRYFTTGGAKGRLETGAIVTWEFGDFPGPFPVTVVEAQSPNRIALRWGAEEGAAADGNAETTVTFTFEAKDDDRTFVTITEAGFADNETGWSAALNQTGGWTAMLCAMKVWVEHGINLREGFYV